MTFVKFSLKKLHFKKEIFQKFKKKSMSGNDSYAQTTSENVKQICVIQMTYTKSSIPWHKKTEVSIQEANHVASQSQRLLKISSTISLSFDRSRLIDPPEPKSARKGTEMFKKHIIRRFLH